MGMIGKLFGLFLGGGRNVIVETAEVFRPNAEAASQRSHEYNAAALEQYAAEFHARANRTWFDSLVDGLNRMVRPVITLTLLGVIPVTMAWPEHMAVALASLALLPTGYWALVSLVTSFYYGGRMQLKSHEFHQSVAEAVARAPQVIENIQQLRKLFHDSPGVADTGTDADLANDATQTSRFSNAAVDDWDKAK